MSDWLRNTTREELEQRSRAGATATYIGSGTVLCRVLDEFGMFVPGADLSLAPHLILDGFWESWVTRAIAQFVKPGDRVIDVGACFGYFTLLLADLVGPTGRVLALEPMLPTMGLLERNVEINGFSDRCRLVMSAAGAKNGTGTMRFPISHWGSARMDGQPLLPRLGLERTKETSTPFASLDRMCAARFERKAPTFVKIDAEGSELAIWRGMQGIWKANKEMTVCMEYAAELGGDELVAELRSDGATVQIIDPLGDVVPFKSLGPMEMLWVTHG